MEGNIFCLLNEKRLLLQRKMCAGRTKTQNSMSEAIHLLDIGESTLGPELQYELTR
jgi:hypothetical protein